MTSRIVRSSGPGAIALAVTLALSATLVVSPPWIGQLQTVRAQARLLDTESWIMGGSGLPIPSQAYLDALSERYVNPSAYPFGGSTLPFAGQPTFGVAPANAHALFTPEGLYPFTGIKNLELDPSVAQGVSILNSTITDATDPIVVVGYSQSATISSLEMKNLLALPTADQPAHGDLSFVLLGDPSNPNGGLLSRFDLTTLPDVGAKMPQLTIPSLGVTFSGATPADTPWQTAIYTQEYDGFADFPKYPLNFLADLNALMGILEVHGKYPSLTADHIADAIQLGTSTDYTGPLANTDYFMIPTADLPLLDPLRGAGSFGNALADLLQPDLKILIDLGYGNLDTQSDLENGLGGWDTGPANLPTPFGLAPNVDFGDLMTALATGAKMGWDDFLNDLAHPAANLPDLPDLSDSAVPLLASMPSFTDIVNALSGALSNAYATLLPTADIINALFTTLPAYAGSIFAQYLAAGDLIDAFGMPLAATTGLTTMAMGFELIAIENAVSAINSELSGLFS